ncbi:hypothetical protein [Oxynema aestuarii]|jgi:hypothetical protein|uniref:Gas vesicle protein n=1 Tax=Oxynema aestuarii AP17 TaxID=2064643 RepID=A0A6H1TYY7_9CYAN|nr:hypothetical protein [Oxynema aestuarii]QIZ71791.1 hypothetical protein HCG48_15380 [Oxynema aestuarii AP17]RMH70627.1 MAG: hypothetical protein D6680_23135 [Cyanobacteria bacterium J007]
MQRPRPQTPIHSKLTNIPRNNTEAGEQLELYKLLTQRQRIEQEMKVMQQRLQVLEEQLEVIDRHIENSEQKARQLRQSSSLSSGKTAVSQRSTSSKTGGSQAPPHSRTTGSNSGDRPRHFETFYLDY